MRRRQVLTALGTTIPFGGCLGATKGGESPDKMPTATTDSYIEITAPTVSQGETATITITARSVTRLHFSDVPDSDATIEYENGAFSPSPSVVWQGKPPTWQWSTAESVTGDVPLTVPETVPPGDYRYAIAGQIKESEDELIEGFVVTVQS